MPWDVQTHGVTNRDTENLKNRGVATDGRFESPTNNFFALPVVIPVVLDYTFYRLGGVCP